MQGFLTTDKFIMLFNVYVTEYLTVNVKEDRGQFSLVFLLVLFHISRVYLLQPGNNMDGNMAG